MKFIRDTKRRTVTVRFEDSFTIRDAISLPNLVARLPIASEIILDFSDVRWMRESAMIALIPALGSIHGRKLTVRGLESGELRPLALVPMAA